MSDPAPSAPTPVSAPPEPAAQTRGYFNRAQLTDIQEAEDICAAARSESHAAALAILQITPEYVAGLAEALATARRKITATGQDGDVKKTATLKTTGKARSLLLALQGIQSAAKQKRRMLAEDDDPATASPLKVTSSASG